MYADDISEAMEEAIKETKRRRKIQEEYNLVHHIEPMTIIKDIHDVVTNEVKDKKEKTKISKKDKEKLKLNIEEEMKLAAKNLDFERAMELRDILFEMESED